MSSTMRLFVNDNRVSTAVKVRSGSILQVYPTKRQFASDVEWKQFWEQELKPKIILRFSEEKTLTAASASAPAPALTAADTDPAAIRALYVEAAARAAAGAPPRAKAKRASLKNWNFTPTNSFSKTLPAGTYYIGDLCYALSDDVYDNVFGDAGYESGIYAEKDSDRVFLVNGTAYGDGEYPGSDGNRFAVDAGIIGICSQSLMEKSGDGGHVYTFTSPVHCTFKRDGRFFFSDQRTRLVVDTTGDDDAY
jgi:hypothetical protein